MKKNCVIGHFGFGENMLNGQTVKTKIVTSELEKEFGLEEISKIDTHGGIKKLPSLVLKTILAIKNCNNITILPARNGIKIIVPLCTVINLLFHRKLHYVVIGGWLNDALAANRVVEKCLKKFVGIYVETIAMCETLKARGFNNIFVMPNFKDLPILTKQDLVYTNSEPYRLCTFSRVMKEKGIEDAVNAVSIINNRYGRAVFTLDIFGQVDEKQTDWFDDLLKKFPSYISYRGVIPFDKSVECLKKYHALLFPTYYSGEGFAGTLLDAMASGVPVIASDWKYNSEIVVPGKTGILVKTKDLNSLVDAIEHTISDSWRAMKISCLEEAEKYKPQNAIQVLIKRL